MATQLICDDCGEVIDQTQPYYSVNAIKQQMVDGVLTVVEAGVTVDFHVEHLPWELPASPAVTPLPAVESPSPDVPVAAAPSDEPT